MTTDLPSTVLQTPLAASQNEIFRFPTYFDLQHREVHNHGNDAGSRSEMNVVCKLGMNHETPQT